METVKLNARQVTNEETSAIELQGSAVLQSIGNNVLENSNGTKYKIGNIAYDHNGTTEVKSAQIFEKTYAGNPEKGTAPVAKGDIVAINISADETNTYFRVIGTGSAGLESKDLFASLMGTAKPMVVANQEEEADVPA